MVSWAIEALVALLDPVWWITRVLEFVAWMIGFFLQSAPAGVRDSITGWAEALSSGALSDFLSAGTYFIGWGVHLDLFIWCCRISFGAWLIALVFKLVMKIIALFWAGGGA